MTAISLREQTGEYVLDAARTRIGFVAKHTMATRVRGRFAAFEGGGRFDGDDPSQSTISLAIEADSIDTGNPRRDDPLRRFFLDVDSHPVITFDSTEVRRLGDGDFAVTGDLRVRGVARPVTVDFRLTGSEHDPPGSPRFTFKGRTVIDRHDWGVDWNAATRLMIRPQVVLELEVAAYRRP